MKANLLLGELLVVSKPDKKIVVVENGKTFPIRARPISPPRQYILGAKYEHPVFGLGVLDKVEKSNAGLLLSLTFSDGAVRKFSSRIAKLKDAPQS